MSSFEGGWWASKALPAIGVGAGSDIRFPPQNGRDSAYSPGRAAFLRLSSAVTGHLCFPRHRWAPFRLADEGRPESQRCSRTVHASLAKKDASSPGLLRASESRSRWLAEPS